MLPTYSRLFTTVCALAATATAVTPVVVDGKDFVDSKTGDRFQIIGVDYQPGGSGGFSTKKDPLSSPKDCLRDAALMQRLGVNTVRVYNLSPELNHDECASIFNAAGIYLILDVNSPLEGDNLDRTGPENSYNAEYFKQVFGVIEAFKDFPNTLAFFSGNEVINEQSSKKVPAYIRAVQRDMKDYISKHAKRSIPVGYSAADVRGILMDTVNYFQCEIKDSPNSRADFFGLNSYSWCGDSDLQKSGYDTLTKDFSDASLPVFFSEYGCNAVEPRPFSEVQAIYGPEMSQAFSGGLVYEFVQEENDFGLVNIKDNGDAALMVDFENLRTQFGKLNMDRIKTSNKTQTSVEPVECSPDLITSEDFLNSFDLPKRPGEVQGMIEHGCDFVKPGKLVSVSDKTIPQTVVDHHGREVSDVRLSVVKDSEANDPDDIPDDSHGANEDNDDGDKDSEDDKDEDGNKDSDKDSDRDSSKEKSTDTSGSSNSDSTSDAADSHTSYDPESAAGRVSTSTSMFLGLLSGAMAVAVTML